MRDAIQPQVGHQNEDQNKTFAAELAALDQLDRDGGRIAIVDEPAPYVLVYLERLIRLRGLEAPAWKVWRDCVAYTRKRKLLRYLTPNALMGFVNTWTDRLRQRWLRLEGCLVSARAHELACAESAEAPTVEAERRRVSLKIAEKPAHTGDPQKPFPSVARLPLDRTAYAEAYDKLRSDGLSDWAATLRLNGLSDEGAMTC